MRLIRYSEGVWITRSFALTAAVGSMALSAVAIAVLVGTSNGTVDMFGRPLGTDFSSFWSAGRLAIEGRAGDAYRWAVHYEVQKDLHGPNTPLYVWAYPPPFLLIVSALALLPYLAALGVWLSITLISAVWVVVRIVPGHLSAALALGCPTTLVCLLHGQNGFLTVSLLGFGLLFLERRPVLSGALFGCLIYKPHMGLLIPAVLLAGRQWRAIAAGSIMVITLTLLSLMLFGWQAWQGFWTSFPLARLALIEEGTPGWEKIQTVFAWARMWGGSVRTAYVVQAIVAAIAIAACCWQIFANKPVNVRNASVCAGVVLTTPFALDYDLLVLGVGVAFLVAEGQRVGFLPWEKTVLAVIWVAPALARAASLSLSLPLGVAASVALLVLSLRRAGATPHQR